MSGYELKSVQIMFDPNLREQRNIWSYVCLCGGPIRNRASNIITLWIFWKESFCFDEEKKELPFRHSPISPSRILSSVDIRKINLLDVTLIGLLIECSLISCYVWFPRFLSCKPLSMYFIDNITLQPLKNWPMILVWLTLSTLRGSPLTSKIVWR